MKHPLLLLGGLPLALWAVFSLPDVAASAHTLWDWRRALIPLTGTLALGWMSTATILATRPGWLEQGIGGLDRLYRLHKEIGIAAGVIVFSHWMLEWLPKNLAKAGWIERPFRGPRPPRGPESTWIDLAEDVGEWAGYIMLALALIALVKRIPYRYFRWLHKLFPLVFLAGTYHGLMLMPESWWRQPLGWLSAALAAGGVIAAVTALAGRMGAGRRVEAVVDALGVHPGGIVEVSCRPLGQWPGHAAGQHVLANFGDRGEGAHPFTVASAWDPKDGRLTLAIKTLGDYTRTLTERLTTGRRLQLEGPYGAFTFATRDSGAHQVWVAGGIGVTPFLARLHALAAMGGSPAQVDFFYSTAGQSDFPPDLPALCAAARVRLHRRNTDQDGPLPETEVIRRLHADSSVWFCGPGKWGESLEKALLKGHHLETGAFHRELFEFR